MYPVSRRHPIGRGEPGRCSPRTGSVMILVPWTAGRSRSSPTSCSTRSNGASLSGWARRRCGSRAGPSLSISGTAWRRFRPCRDYRRCPRRRLRAARLETRLARRAQGRAALHLPPRLPFNRSLHLALSERRRPRRRPMLGRCETSCASPSNGGDAAGGPRGRGCVLDALPRHRAARVEDRKSGSRWRRAGCAGPSGPSLLSSARENAIRHGLGSRAGPADRGAGARVGLERAVPCLERCPA